MDNGIPRGDNPYTAFVGRQYPRRPISGQENTRVIYIAAGRCEERYELAGYLLLFREDGLFGFIG